MIDFTASQAQPSAEFARPLRQTILVDTDQRCRIVGHDRHARLYNRAEMALVGEAPRSTAQQTGLLRSVSGGPPLEWEMV